MSFQQSTNPSTPSSLFVCFCSWLWIINTVKVRMVDDSWLDTQCGVPEITVSPDECSCEDSSKVYRLLQSQIQGAIPYGKVAPSRCTVHCNSVPIPEAVCCAELKQDKMVCMDDKAVVPVGNPAMPLSTGVRPHNEVLAPTEGPELVAMDHDFASMVLSHIFKKNPRPFPYSHNEIIKKSSHPSYFTRWSIQRLHFFISFLKKSPAHMS